MIGQISPSGRSLLSPTMNGVNSTNNVIGKTAAERDAQRLYWTEHSVETTVEAMMLDSQAKIIDKEERPEVHNCQLAWAGFSSHDEAYVRFLRRL